MALDYGRVVGFKQDFVTLHHPIRAANADGGEEKAFAQSYLAAADLNPPYRILRPFSRFDRHSGMIAFELDGREVLVPRDQVAIGKGSLAGRSRAAILSLTQISVRQVKIWYGPPPDAEPIDQGLNWRVKPLRLAVATAFVMFLFLLAPLIDPWGLFTAASRRSDEVYQQIYYSTIYPWQYSAFYESKNAEARERGGRPAVQVIELLEQDLNFYEETWPVSYDFHAWVLESILEQKPAAVFVDIAFIDDRSDENNNYADYMQEVVEAYSVNDIPLLFAAPNCVRPFFLQNDRVGESGVKTMAVAVPGGRFHRQGFIYPLSFQDPSSLECAPRPPEPLPAPAPMPAELEDRSLDQQRQEPAWHGLPSAGCALYVQATNRMNRLAGKAGVLTDSWCFDPLEQAASEWEKPVLTGVAGTLQPKDVRSEAPEPVFREAAGAAPSPAASTETTEILLHWSSQPFEEQIQELSGVEPRPDETVLNGRYPCILVSRDWWLRIWKLITGDEQDQFRSALRQTCPPQKNFTVAQLLDGSLSFWQEADNPDSLNNSVVIYAQNLLGDQDRVSPPTHWPLPGAYFHATAADNLFTYGRVDDLLKTRDLWGLPKEQLLMLLGFLLVVPIWEYGFMIMGRIERLGSGVREARDAFIWYGRWVGVALLLPAVSAAVVLGLVIAATSVAGPEPLNFLGLFGLVFLRALPRAWRLMPPLWPGLGGWRRGPRSPFN